MTRKHALYNLLKHGPMTAVQLTECTKWHRSSVYKNLDLLIEHGTVRRVNAIGGYLFEVV